jgi:corrinoid protein of di/trimethylamine methyltransferase
MMFMKQDIFIQLKEAVFFYEVEKARELAEEVVRLGIDPVEALEVGLAQPLREVGQRFESGEAFITELIASAEVMEAGADVLNKEIVKRGANRDSVGKVLIGTVEGDIHSIGKNIVSTLLNASGFEVIDLGIDVPTWTFVEKVKELNPDILGLSALMTTTMVKQKEVIGALMDTGLRQRVKIIVGGAPVTEEWAKEIGADAAGFDAGSAVQLALNLMEVH